jgi:hypothetical protein
MKRKIFDKMDGGVIDAKVLCKRFQQCLICGNFEKKCLKLKK